VRRALRMLALLFPRELHLGLTSAGLQRALQGHGTAKDEEEEEEGRRRGRR